MMSLPRVFSVSVLLAALLFSACPRGSSSSSTSDAGPRDAGTKPAAPVDAGAGPRAPDAAHGAALYTRMCAVCHGAEGQGYVADHAPMLAQQDFLATVSDDFLRFAIAVGRRGTTMSAWQSDHGGPLTPADVEDVIAHLRSWQKQPRVKLASSTLTGEIERGKRLFKQHCESCHGAQAEYVHILNRQLLYQASAPFLGHAIRHGRSGTKMPAFADTLGEQGIADVLSYLTDLPAWPVPGEVPGQAAPPPIPLGPVPLNPQGPEPRKFQAFPAMTSVDVVARELARGARMVLIDARASSDYAQLHIAGAVSVPFYDPYPYLDALPKDTWLVCYCGCPHAESGSLAKQLLQANFSKVTVLDEGLNVWIDKRHPVKSGVTP